MLSVVDPDTPLPLQFKGDEHVISAEEDLGYQIPLYKEILFVSPLVGYGYDQYKVILYVLFVFF